MDDYLVGFTGCTQARCLRKLPCKAVEILDECLLFCRAHPRSIGHHSRDDRIPVLRRVARFERVSLSCRRSRRLAGRVDRPRSLPARFTSRGAAFSLKEPQSISLSRHGQRDAVACQVEDGTLPKPQCFEAKVRPGGAGKGCQAENPLTKRTCANLRGDNSARHLWRLGYFIAMASFTETAASGSCNRAGLQ